MDPNNNDPRHECCPICLDSLVVTSSTQQVSVQQQPSSSIGASVPCGHCFHVSCLDEWTATSIERKIKTVCPTCKTLSMVVVKLNHETASASHNEDTDNEHVEKVDTYGSRKRLRGEESQIMPFVGACVPCGHYIYGESWDRWVENTVQQTIRSMGTTTQQRHTKCPTCSVAVTGVVRLYNTNTLSSKNHPISTFNHLIDTSLNENYFSSNCTNLWPSAASHRITVTGAGTSAVNGVYFLNGIHEKSFRYARYGLWNSALLNFNIFVCKLRSRQRYWFISIVSDFTTEGTDCDIDFYRASITESCETIPPRDGWEAVGSLLIGTKPYPSLSYQCYVPPFSRTMVDKACATSSPSEQKRNDQTTEVGYVPLDDYNEASTSVCDSPTHVVVEKAGNPYVNGMYVHDGYVHGSSSGGGGTAQYVRDVTLSNDRRHMFYIFLCHVSDEINSWYISSVPYDHDQTTTRSDLSGHCQPSSSSSSTTSSSNSSGDITFYYMKQISSTDSSTNYSTLTVPPRQGWEIIGAGKEPSPRLVRLVQRSSSSCSTTDTWVDFDELTTK